MIPAGKSRWFTALFARHARRRIRRRFGLLQVQGLDEARSALTAGPVLVVSNHTAWWDALVILTLSELVLRADGYALMGAENLRRFPFFGRVGAFGVDLDRPGDGLRAVGYAARLLDRPGRLVWIFPQGRERPASERPLRFLGGAAAIARLAPAVCVLPAALRYEFGAREDPNIHVAFGPPLPRAASLDAAVRAQSDAVAGLLDAIEARLCAGAAADCGTSVLARPEWRSTAMLAWLLARLTTRGVGRTV